MLASKDSRKTKKMDGLVTVGLILVIIGVVLIVLGSANAKDSKIGFGGVIGPFVIGFGNDPQLTKIAIVVSVIMAILFILFFLRAI